MIRLTGLKSSKHYPEPIRMTTYEDIATGEVYRFLTNNTALNPLTVSELYRELWQVELLSESSSILKSSHSMVPVKTQDIVKYEALLLLRKRL